MAFAQNLINKAKLNAARNATAADNKAAGGAPVYDPVGGGIVGYTNPAAVAADKAAVAAGGPVKTSTLLNGTAANAASQGVAAGNAAVAPPDTYGAVLRELARARTQQMMRDTNGYRGSLTGAGLGQGDGFGFRGPATPSSQLFAGRNRILQGVVAGKMTPGQGQLSRSIY